MGDNATVFGVSMSFTPFECPICFCRYGRKNLPTTLPCGHSCCINDSHLLAGGCPICREPVGRTRDLKPTFSLRDGSQQFWDLMVELGYVQREEEETEELTRSLSIESQIAVPTTQTASDPNPNPTVTTHDISRASSASSEEVPTYSPTTHMRLQVAGEERLNRVMERYQGSVTLACGHQCTMNTLDRCCYCIDRRPFVDLYPNYVDGTGWVENGLRWEHYCPQCRTIPENERNTRLTIARERMDDIPVPHNPSFQELAAIFPPQYNPFQPQYQQNPPQAQFQQNSLGNQYGIPFNNRLR